LGDAIDKRPSGEERRRCLYDCSGTLPTLIRRQNYCASVATLLSKQTSLTIFREPSLSSLNKEGRKDYVPIQSLASCM
jgi:hypothetical protein